MLLVAFYDIHGRKREVLFFCSVPDTTRDLLSEFISILIPLKSLNGLDNVVDFKKLPFTPKSVY
jgi:hypothetical protein